MAINLSRITKVNPRDIWKHEALDFTQWLAKEENISILCEELGIEIENIKPEASAGRYNVDIIADEIDSKRKVIIENQLEPTDHKHLGQILTYASSYDAAIIIWIVTDYTEEHRQAIDWFNRNIHLWTIKTNIIDTIPGKRYYELPFNIQNVLQAFFRTFT